MSWCARLCLVVAGLCGATAVALAAYAAHGLVDAGPYVTDLMDKATRYQMLHALALLGIAALHDMAGGSLLLRLAAALMAAGVVLFCGALYAIALADWPWAGAAPFGGMAFVLGWLCVSLSVFRLGTKKETAAQ
jgi:uncharacterized membrane protein YgdD (TMEM256/DUF423 family)